MSVRLALAVVGAAAMTSVLATPAHANSGRSDACPSWACGSATATFQDAYTMNPIGMSVRDSSCNGSIAFVKLHIYYTDGSGTYTQPRYDTSTCDNVYKSYNGLSFRGSKRIKGFRVVVGDGVNGQREGSLVDNRFT